MFEFNAPNYASMTPMSPGQRPKDGMSQFKDALDIMDRFKSKTPPLSDGSQLKDLPAGRQFSSVSTASPGMGAPTAAQLGPAIGDAAAAGLGSAGASGAASALAGGAGGVLGDFAAEAATAAAGPAIGGAATKIASALGSI
jgi:hypothetical protein